jgi:threonine dehydratase
MVDDVTFDDVKRAARAVQGALVRTPTRPSLTLSQITGAQVWLKFENRQFTASFKERGALNRLLTLTDAEKARGVVAMSAGNHAQGVAYHAGRLGIPATIVMPLATPFTKVRHTRDFGARVILEGHDLSHADAVARAIADEQGLTFIHPYDDPQVIAGQGTVALEMLEDVPDLEALVVPVGGGGLVAGMAVAARAMAPDIAIHGVQTELYSAMTAAMRGEEITAHPSVQTIAEGIAVKAPGRVTTQMCRALGIHMMTVSEPAIEHGLAALLEIEKTLVEGAAAAAYAALLAEPALFKGRKVGVVLSGGNIDMRLLSNVILRELNREGRIMALTLEIEDRPGTLARVSTIVGEAGGNILEVSHNRMLTGIPVKSATLGMLIEARDAAHSQEIRDRLAAQGFVQAVPASSNGSDKL